MTESLPLLETFISRCHTNGYRWFVYDAENSHVMAQGYAKKAGTAENQACVARLLMLQELTVNDS